MRAGRCKAIAALAGMWWATLLLQAGAVGAQGRFVVSGDGTQVSDSRTGLIWRRCSEGQSFGGGTCTGSPGMFTHEGALAHARTQAGWRLPNVKELASIVDGGRSAPSIDLVTFPATAGYWYWSSSPCVGYAGNAWFVNFYDGVVYYDYRNNLLHVRLVR